MPLNRINGTSSDNFLIGTNADDAIFPGEGEDTVNAGGGNDLIVGKTDGAGLERDTLRGQDGNDLIISYDFLSRFPSDGKWSVPSDFFASTEVDGGNGNDTIIGGGGQGGAGNDVFVAIRGVTSRTELGDGDDLVIYMDSNKRDGFSNTIGESGADTFIFTTSAGGNNSASLGFGAFSDESIDRIIVSGNFSGDVGISGIGPGDIVEFSNVPGINSISDLENRITRESIIFNIQIDSDTILKIGFPDAWPPVFRFNETNVALILNSIQRDVFNSLNDNPIRTYNLINGDSNSNSIQGSPEYDSIFGFAGNDTLSGLLGNDFLFGGLGRDSILGGFGGDVLVGDGALGLSPTAQSIRRLYIATLDRAPDDAGWAEWVAARDGGQTLDNIAAGFVNSAEFQAKYGTLNNTQFVTQLYRNVLDREPDTAGLAANVRALDANQLTRTQIVTGFSESAEFITGTSAALHAGQIYRLYGATLARAPDTGGFEGWTDALASGRGLVDIASGFVNSAEFQIKYGDQTNTGFLTLLYQNVLGRAPDAGGLAYWKGQLDSQSQTRTQVVTGFSESQEYVNGTRSATDAFMRSTMTAWSDTLIGGEGDDLLTGGRGSDRYVIARVDPNHGNDTIYGFESHDTLQLTGFGFADSAAALRSMSQQGANVLFSYDRGSVTFADTQLSTLQGMQAQGWVLG